MPNGVVKWFSGGRGYGFITQDGGADVYVHFTGIAGDGFKTLRRGDAVEFELEDGTRGGRAANVRKIDPPGCV